MQKFKVIKRIEVPRSEYSYDTAVNLIVELNAQYNPSWIYCDAGAGEYQIERLHIIGEERPSTGLKNKVKRMNFKTTLDITDPITFEKTKQPLKPFMVTQLQIAFEREKVILSPFDELLHKQLIDYCVEKIGANGQPVFTSVNEHFVDALGLSYLAMVLEFKELTDMLKEPVTSTKIATSKTTLGQAGLNDIFNEIESQGVPGYNPLLSKIDFSDRRGDRQSQFKLPLGAKSPGVSGGTWGSRSGRADRRGGSGGRRSW